MNNTSDIAVGVDPGNGSDIAKAASRPKTSAWVTSSCRDTGRYALVRVCRTSGITSTKIPSSKKQLGYRMQYLAHTI